MLERGREEDPWHLLSFADVVVVVVVVAAVFAALVESLVCLVLVLAGFAFRD